MPSSDYHSIPKVLQVVERLQPRSILDIGMGHGRYGFLFREILDWNYGRLNQNDWAVEINAVEVETAYIRPHQQAVYNRILVGDWLKDISISDIYDLIFMGDVLEHFGEGDWQLALTKARAFSDVTLAVSPNHIGSMNQNAWHGFEHERHRSLLSAEKVGGRLLFADSKMFMVGFDNRETGVLNCKDICR
jgi:SAM-dependent methyltransferase